MRNGISYLESRNDVALDGISCGGADLVEVEIAAEGVQRHGSANDSRIVSH